MPRVVVTGGRRVGPEVARAIVTDLERLLPASLRRVAQGGAPGADLLARVAWRALRERVEGWAEQTVAVDLALDGPWPAAGARRNARLLVSEMAAARAAGDDPAGVLVLAYPDPASRDTWDCVRQALTRGLTVIVRAPHVVDERFFSALLRGCSTWPRALATNNRRVIFPPWATAAARARLTGVASSLS